MGKSVLIAATTLAAASEHFRIPSLVWSPDMDANRTTGYDAGTGTTTTTLYDGSERAPRSITVLLCAGPGEELPADAELYIEVRTHDAVTDEGGAIITPAQYERIATLTPTRKEWHRYLAPIENVWVRKPESGPAAYGAIAFGLHGDSPSNSN